MDSFASLTPANTIIYLLNSFKSPTNTEFYRAQAKKDHYWKQEAIRYAAAHKVNLLFDSGSIFPVIEFDR